jgi:hypothetical protein
MHCTRVPPDRVLESNRTPSIGEVCPIRGFDTRLAELPSGNDPKTPRPRQSASVSGGLKSIPIGVSSYGISTQSEVTNFQVSLDW